MRKFIYLFLLVLLSIQAYSQNPWTPYTTSTNLRNGAVGTPDAVILTDKQGYTFRYDSTSTMTDDSAMVIRLGNRRYVRVIGAYITPEIFGAVGDGATDDTQPIRSCIEKAALFNVRVEFRSLRYKVTNTLAIGYGVGKTHINGNGATIVFHNSDIDKPLFSLTPYSSHSLIENIAIEDSIKGTSTAVRIASYPVQPTGPNWKNLFRNVRVSDFKTGAHFTTNGDPTEPEQSGWASENLFLHCKFRNCRVSVLLDNMQSVNNTFSATDIENDDSGEQYEMIRYNAGGGMTVENASLIGRGWVFTWKGLPGLFVNSNISFTNCRIEARSGHIRQLIYQEYDDGLYAANRIFISMNEVNVEPFTQNLDLIHFSGRMYFSGNGISGSSGSIAVRQFPVAGISGALGVGNFASVKINNSIGIRSIEDTTATSVYGSYNKRYSVPVEIDDQFSSTNGSNQTDAKGFIVANNPSLSMIGYGLSNVKSSRLVFNDPNEFVGFESVKFILPKYATPTKLIMFKQPVRFSINIQYKLYIVKDVQQWANQNAFNPVTDAYLVADTGDTNGKSGFFEAPIQMTQNTIGYRMQGGVSDTWTEGRMYLENSGGAFAGFAGVEYY